ncbi:hypothetical protein SCP_1401170 [Sparassis crispa]|uniref:Uncharacterized protein n=1 Tax=Sparassis crispa TaxID=139825 RepID=A0A401H2T5_9APHY|nr:hypothetical protein SCP_1401170 [Sparassis crispa]GBE88712.1 hypothetical protein SCP_1401170 [Sparassis crispa]
MSDRTDTGIVNVVCSKGDDNVDEGDEQEVRGDVDAEDRVNAADNVYAADNTEENVDEEDDTDKEDDVDADDDDDDDETDNIDTYSESNITNEPEDTPDPAWAKEKELTRSHKLYAEQACLELEDALKGEPIPQASNLKVLRVRAYLPPGIVILGLHMLLSLGSPSTTDFMLELNFSTTTLDLTD